MSKVKDYVCEKCKQVIEPYQEYQVYENEERRFVIVCQDCYMRGAYMGIYGKRRLSRSREAY